MVKKVIVYVLLLVFSVSTFSACNKNKDSKQLGENAINLYFVSGVDGTFVTEEYTLKSTGVSAKIEEGLKRLIKGPSEVGERTLLSPDIEVNKVFIENDIVKIVFAHDYVINARNEFMARASILSTIGQIEGVSNVEIFIEDQPLKDANDKTVGTIHINNYIVSTASPDDFKRKTNIALYFANEDGTKLIEEIISADIPFSLPIEYTIVELLIEGPISKGQYPSINPKTKINSIKTKNGICFIDLSKEFLENPNNLSEEVAVYSLVNTLTELLNFNKVRIYIDGKNQSVYRDEIKINKLLERNLDVVED